MGTANFGIAPLIASSCACVSRQQDFAFLRRHTFPFEYVLMNTVHHGHLTFQRQAISQESPND
jgi:hypothetical protein